LLVEQNVGPLISEGTADDCALARYGVLGTILVDVVLQVETKHFDAAQSARCETICAELPLVLLEVQVLVAEQFISM
jgi:hypothetical protein